MGDLISRYTLMDRLHEFLKPRIYLEIGVQYGYSLRQARPGTRAIGVDPDPQISAEDIQAQSNAATSICRMTSDQYFASAHREWFAPGEANELDFAFVDGMHLAEYAWRDLVNIEKWAHPRTVVAIDDVLPYSPAIAERVMPPGGDWTGDVWKILPMIAQHRPHLKVILVDCFPVGLALVYGFNDRGFYSNPSPLELERLQIEAPPPVGILERWSAIPADLVIPKLAEELPV
jgi:hypothetical protein